MSATDHPAVVAWRRLDTGAPSPSAVERLERAWKRKTARAVYRLHFAGRRTEVIAKPCSRDEALRTLTIEREILSRLPVARPGEIAIVEEKDGSAWLFLAAVDGEPYEPARAEHRHLAGEWLAMVHTAASRLDGAAALGPFGFPYEPGATAMEESLSVLRARLAERSAGRDLSPAGSGLLAALAAQAELVARRRSSVVSFCRRWPATLVHGDFCVSNMLVRRNGDAAELVVFDWQRSGWGSMAFDLTRFLGSWTAPDLAAYLAIARREWPDLDLETVRRLAFAGELVRWIDAARWEVERLSWEDPELRIDQLRLYVRWMKEVERAAPWRNNPALGRNEWRSLVPYSRPRRLRDGEPVHA